MKTKILLACLLVVASWLLIEISDTDNPGELRSGSQFADNRKLIDAIESRRSDVQVKGRAKVIRLLADDLKGSRHQRFLLQLNQGGTLLVAHNIDLAPRIDNLQVDDWVEFFGEYEWNNKGGVIHWTHIDPSGRHVDGWLKHGGQIYQ